MSFKPSTNNNLSNSRVIDEYSDIQNIGLVSVQEISESNETTDKKGLNDLHKKNKPKYQGMDHIRELNFT